MNTQSSVGTIVVETTVRSHDDMVWLIRPLEYRSGTKDGSVVMGRCILWQQDELITFGGAVLNVGRQLQSLLGDIERLLDSLAAK
jgi:hypothetical protein